jgi:two-component system, LytTR family, sensor kinase
MTRRWIGLQLLIGWTPIWVLFVTLLWTAHPGIGARGAALVGLRMIVPAAALSLVVQRLARRLPWPHPMRPSFVAIHLAAAGLFAATWVLLNSVLASLLRGAIVFVVGGAGLGPFLVLGVWLYVMIAGVVYAAQATERAARVEAIAARSQLAALRAQLQPHFLFNALHTVVHLIPREPRRAAQAAEQIAGLLRTTLEQESDVVSLATEWAFVERYLEIERVRFEDRMQVQADLPREALALQLPSFALQTLVENAVRHGVAPRVEPTQVTVTARAAGGRLTLSVRDTGMGGRPEEIAAGTGLKRLRERLAVLYGKRARLELASPPGGGFEATLEIPQGEDGDPSAWGAGDGASSPSAARSKAEP